MGRCRCAAARRHVTIVVMRTGIPWWRWKWVGALMLALTASSAHAALDIGDRAPDFTTEAALGGKVFQYSLAQALRKGPVVLYFFPAAFSEGCSAEAHYFAEAMPQFEALGATVVGVSADDIATLAKFSLQACQSKFPVASDQAQVVIKGFDAVLLTRPEYANRISYVIAPSGAVVSHYMSLNPNKHVEKMLGALRAMAPKPP
jgi:peroxiredoxin